MAALKDVSRRWHVPPAFSVEFVGYYLERNSRVTSLRRSLERLTKENETLLGGDEKLRTDYDDVSEIMYHQPYKWFTILTLNIVGMA